MCALLLAGTPAAAETPRPVGCAVAGLESFDAQMIRLIDKWDIPGASLAVAHDGRLLLAHGYGLSDRAKQSVVTPETRFRLGSLAKPITAVAVLKLVEERKLDLDDPILPLLGELAPPAGAITDERVRRITVRHLLQHRGGFDRDKSGDPMFMPLAAEALARQGNRPPITCAMLLRDALGRRLDFDPGARYAYSNLGYCILGRIVERASGTKFWDFAQSRVLKPSGALGVELGHTMITAPDETVYYGYPGAQPTQAMPGVAEGRVMAPYGAYAVEEMDSYGALIASPRDYLKFMLAIDGQRGPALLSPASLKEMRARPVSPGADPAASGYYGIGIQVRTLADGGQNWFHGGSQSGAMALAVRTQIGHSWVVAVNSRPHDQRSFSRALDEALWTAAKQVVKWPDGDLFDRCETRG